jgi:hypothetical protein
MFKIEQTALGRADRKNQESGGLLLIGENKRAMASALRTSRS